MNTGKKLRLNRLFVGDGRLFIVAIDHATFGQVKGLEMIKPLVQSIIEGGTDGFIANPGTITEVLADLKGIAVIMTIPYEPSMVRFAAKLGVDAIKTSYFGNPNIPENYIIKISRIAAEANEWGIPYILELDPVDDLGKTLYDIEALKLICKAGSELGADIIKASYVGPPERYGEVVNACEAPIIVRGGEKMSNTADFLDIVANSIKAGAIGAAIGRNIWQERNPKLISSIVWKLIHGKLSKDEALKLL